MNSNLTTVVYMHFCLVASIPKGTQTLILVSKDGTTIGL
jgi:hypothetical protein